MRINSRFRKAFESGSLAADFRLTKYFDGYEIAIFSGHEWAFGCRGKTLEHALDSFKKLLLGQVALYASDPPSEH